MEEKTKLTQKDYQRKYDGKTKSVMAKYVLSDMDEYDRLMDYLKRTRKSANSFIKELIKDFFEQEKYEINRRRIAEYFWDYNISHDQLEELKVAIGDERYETVIACYKERIVDELDSAYNDEGDAFDEWVGFFLEDIEMGEVDLGISDEEFKEMVKGRFSDGMGYLYYGY